MTSVGVTTVGRIYRFRAIHSLPDFEEPWCFPHQHDYTVEVVAPGGTSTDDLDELWRGIDPGNDADMNELYHPSTVEHIADAMLLRFAGVASAVTVWEDRARWGRAEYPGVPQ